MTWPAITETSDAAWQKAVQDLKKANWVLVRAVSQLDDAILDKKPIRVRGPFYLMLHGTIQHNVYHTGQISLLAGQKNSVRRGDVLVKRLTKIARKTFLILTILVVLYLGIGLAFHLGWKSALAACRETRRAQGEFAEPEVFGDILGLSFDVTFWPVYSWANFRHDGTPFATPCTKSDKLGEVQSAKGELTTYSTADGLISNYVYAIAETPDGDLWFGTQGGVSRFNGEKWVTYTETEGLVYDHVYTIAIAPDGALWFGTGAGVSRFDGETWTTYLVKDGLAHDRTYSIIVAPDGTLWFGTWGGASRFDGKKWTTFTASDGMVGNYVHSIAVAPDRILWFGALAGVSRFDGKKWTTYTTADGLAGNSVHTAAVAFDGAVWLGTDRGISRFDGKTWTSYTPSADGLTNDWINSIAIAHDNVVWFGTGVLGPTGGVLRFDGRRWTSIEDLQDTVVNAVFVTANGDVWFGTWGDGVVRYSPSGDP